MPRLTHSIPKYRKHRASSQAVVVIAGKTHYLGPHGTKASKVEYDRLISEWLASGRSISFGAPSCGLSVSELLVQYLRYAKGYYTSGKRGELANIQLAVRPLKTLYGKTNAADFGVVQFKTLRHKLIESNCSRPYINAQMKRITRLFRWAASEGLVPVEIPQTLAMIPGLQKGRTDAHETAPVLPVPEDAIQAALPHLSRTVADMVRFRRLTGCRPAEVCTIRPCDVDITGEVWTYRPASHKTEHHGRDRVIFIGPKGQAVLRPYVLRPAESYCFSPRDSEKKRRLEIHSIRKTPLSCGNVPGSNRKNNPISFL